MRLRPPPHEQSPSSRRENQRPWICNSAMAERIHHGFVAQTFQLNFAAKQLIGKTVKLPGMPVCECEPPGLSPRSMA